MSYVPTIEDIAYLAMHQPDKFTSAEQTLRSMSHALRNGNGNVDQTTQVTVRRHYANYQLNGGQPLTESPIPRTSGSAEEDGPDTEFAATCVQCTQDDGCCIKAGSVIDKSHPSRKVEWPPVDGATTLLVVAELQGTQLISDVLVNWEGEENCLAGRSDKPCLLTSGLADGRHQITESTSEASVAYQQHLSLALALGDFIPHDVTLALLAFDSLMSLNALNNQGGRASFQPNQCWPGKDVKEALTVIPYPCTKLDGDVTLAVETSFMTHGVSAQVEAKGTLSGQYGRYELTLEGSADSTGHSQESIPRENDAPGLVGMIVNTIQTMDRYISMGSSNDGIRRNSSNMGSGVILSKSLTFQPTGFELAPVAGSPDLEVKIGSLNSTLSVGVTGRIDLIEAVSAALLSPAGRDMVQNARARMEAGENVNATIQGNLQLSAMGSLTHTVNGSGGESVATYRIPASGEPSEAIFNGIAQEFTGELKILGLAELKLHVEGRVFILSAQAGARGSIHTSWTWEVRSRDGVREKRYIFEGVKVSGEAYAEVDFRRGEDTDDSQSLGIESQTGLADSRLEGEAQVSDLFDRVRSAIDNSNRQAAGDIEGFNPNPRGDDGNGKTIWEPDPKEPEWVPF
ncbi:hypothetical protein [Billgrantia aerodenitrificans]|uniref:Uncharacterized protein n=1 Tax=Billgrantia aerodenitrificans TaxID=2733483 RepID=A0ABS9ARA7_9GAMM|nr:hypothetical protein [Halomonas aerodenitrificans]MCE8024171.1 hypothetical protein [Halomonas aerodenitrificans]